MDLKNDQTYAVCKRFTLDLKTQAIQKTGMATVVSVKTD